jgi:hypothetical protein
MLRVYAPRLPPEVWRLILRWNRVLRREGSKRHFALMRLKVEWSLPLPDTGQGRIFAPNAQFRHRYHAQRAYNLVDTEIVRHSRRGPMHISVAVIKVVLKHTIRYVTLINSYGFGNCFELGRQSIDTRKSRTRLL